MNIEKETPNKNSIIMLLVMMFAILLLSSGFAGAKVILWNKLGSEAQISQSEIGPGLLLTSYKFADWQEAKIVPAKFGNGLFVNHDISGWLNDGGNFFAANLIETTFTAEKGTIEFWFQFEYNSSTHNHAYFFNTYDQFANHFDSAYSNSDISLQGSWNGWDYGSSGKRFCFGIANIVLCTPDYSAGPGGELEFDIGTLMHFAFVWDINGIDKTDDTTRIYVNGEQRAASQASWLTDGTLDQYIFIGSRPNSSNWDHYYNAVKGVTDNFIIRDVATTDFSGRFNETPCTADNDGVNYICSLSVPVGNETDDAEENLNDGDVSLFSSDLELIQDGLKPQLVGLRFPLDIPAGATVLNATIQFTADETSSTSTVLLVSAEAANLAQNIGLATTGFQQVKKQSIRTK